MNINFLYFLVGISSSVSQVQVKPPITISKKIQISWLDVWPKVPVKYMNDLTVDEDMMLKYLYTGNSFASVIAVYDRQSSIFFCIQEKYADIIF